MPDRANVLKGLECCTKHECGKECPYHDIDTGCRTDMEIDALVLLKEHDSVDHALEVLRANGWKQTEPICSECDAVHVVQCKDCKYRSERTYTRFDGEEVYVCQINDIAKKPEWFCADGERKDTDA